MLVAIDLAPTLKLRGIEDDDEDDAGIWPAPNKKPGLLLWKILPLDLLFYSVLVRLPFPVLLKLRRVSRSWHQVLSSHDFWFLWFQGKQSPNPNLRQNPSRIPGNANPNSYHVLDRIISNCSRTANYNCPVPHRLLCSAQFKPSRGCQVARWLRQHSIRYVHQQNTAPAHRVPHYWSRLHESFMQVQEPYIILASDGGLVLLAKCSEGSQQLIVCNPLLRAHKVVSNSFLPPLSNISAMDVGFIADKEHGEYRVLLSSVGCQVYRLAVYNSSTGNWTRTSFEDSASASPPILDGSHFWLSCQQLPTNGKATLYVYHANMNIVKCVRTRFPQGVVYPTNAHVWKDSYGLQTLAWSSTWFGTWKLENGLWKCEKALPFSQQKFNLYDVNYVKVDNLLLLRFFKSNQVYVFDFGLDEGCWTPCCTGSEYLTGHCVFQPSCIQV